MKTRLKFAIFASVLIVVASSCKKDDSKLPFSKLTVEENKAVVENSAIEAAKALNTMKDHQAVDASVSLGMHLDKAFPLEMKAAEDSKIIHTVKAVASLNDDDFVVKELFESISSVEELDEDPESLLEVWEMIVGIYDWDPVNEEWIVTENTEKVEINFPSTENGSSNNATLIVYNYTGVTIANPMDSEYAGDLPVSLNIDITVDGALVLAYTFAASYNSDGIPESLATDLTMEPFKLSADLTNNDEKVEAKYLFTQDETTIMEISGKIEGDFTQENIDDHTVTTTETWTDYQYNEVTFQYEEVEITESYDEVKIEEIVETGSFKFQLFNISLNGIGDIIPFADSLKLIYPDGYHENQNFDYKAALEMEAALMNNNISIYALDEDTRTKIAEVEAYVVEENYDGYYDYWIDMRLVFGDGSLVDLETYFENGFEQFVAQINTMISDLNSKYNWDLEPVDY
jgi:hypothetical protein